MALTKAQKKKWKKRLEKHGSLHCPHCDSEDLKMLGRPASADKYITQDAQCFGCGRTWTYLYTLSDVIE